MLPLVESSPSGSGAGEAMRGFWKSGKQWPLLIVALLAGQFAISGTTIYLAHSDPHFGVEPNYYEKAVHWDDTARQRQANQTLAWKPQIEIATKAAGGGQREVSLSLRDANGEAIEQAAIQVESFHHLNSNRRAHWTMLETAPGRYTGSPEMPNAGVWELRFTATRAGKTFTFTETTYVP